MIIHQSCTGFKRSRTLLPSPLSSLSSSFPSSISFSSSLSLSSSSSSSSSRLSPSSLEFYKSIGNPTFISAPMVDQSDLAFRLLVKKNGCDLAFSQMMHARNFVIDTNYRKDCIDWDDEAYGNINDANLDRKNLIVQLAGDNEDILIQAGHHVHQSVAAIDLNCGCPQKIAKRGNYGAYLLRDPPHIVKLLKAMVKNFDCPVTVKIRKVSENDDDTIQLCRAIEDVGVSMITIHGRTVESSKLFTGPADWDIIKKVKSIVSIPVIANGGISCRSDVIKCLEYTNADGVMSSECLLENPKLFDEVGDYNFHHDYVKSQLTTADEYIKILNSHRTPRTLNPVVRSHLFKILYKFMDSPLNYDLRHLLSEGVFNDMLYVIDELNNRLSKINYNTDMAIEKGLINKTNWYMRHRDEKAQKRIYTTRRGNNILKQRGINININNIDTNNDGNNDKEGEGNNEAIKLKMIQLKQRLLEKQKVKGMI